MLALRSGAALGDIICVISGVSAGMLIGENASAISLFLFFAGFAGGDQVGEGRDIIVERIIARGTEIK